MEIQAAVVRASETPYRLETVTLADPGPDEVLVRISAVGMCHTDLLPKAPSARPRVPVWSKRWEARSPACPSATTPCCPSTPAAPV